MSGVGSRETGLDSLFASKPVGPGFEPCLGQSAKLAGAPKPLCLLARRCQLALTYVDDLHRVHGQPAANLNALLIAPDKSHFVITKRHLELYPHGPVRQAIELHQSGNRI